MLNAIRLILIAFIFSVTNLAVAAEEFIMKPTPHFVKVKVQNFELREVFSRNVTIQLRYIKNKLKYIAIENMSNNLIKLRLFNVTHILKPDQDLSLPVPDIENIILEVSKAIPVASAEAESLLVDTTYIFKQDKKDGLYAVYIMKDKTKKPPQAKPSGGHLK